MSTFLHSNFPNMRIYFVFPHQNKRHHHPSKNIENIWWFAVFNPKHTHSPPQHTARYNYKPFLELIIIMHHQCIIFNTKSLWKIICSTGNMCLLLVFACGQEGIFQAEPSCAWKDGEEDCTEHCWSHRAHTARPQREDPEEIGAWRR